jgi:hypothetical protein
MNKRDSRKARKAWILLEKQIVLDILNTWDPIPGSPDDEYECLADRIVSALHKQVTLTRLAELIQSNMADHFGIPVSLEEAVHVAAQIWDVYDLPKS